ncbi:MAG: IS110 family transposase [Bacteroidia bacterium]|nr:IS110 family transposase [Bacteroidia bacterium]
MGNAAHYVTVSPHLTLENVRKFGTFTRDLEALADWLKSLEVTSVAMESTGVYWMPLYELLGNKRF